MNAHPVATSCLLCDQCGNDVPTHGGLLRRCTGCGFSWTVKVADIGPVDYTNEYFDNGPYGAYFTRARQWRYEARQRLRWLRSQVRPASLLEAGSAGGFFLEAASRAKIAVTGIEPSKACVRFARNQLGLTIRRGTLETLDDIAPVEAVCAFHVLEHVDDPRKFLMAARHALVPGGWLALEVPNIASAGASRDGVSWPDLQPSCHNWHFSPETLGRLVEESGFVIRRCDTIFRRYYTRPHRRLIRPRIGTFVRDWQAAGSLRVTHPHLGDFVRLLAQLPSGGPVR